MRPPRRLGGKVFTLSPEHVDAVYPRIADYRALVARLDPRGKFRNAFLERLVFAGRTTTAGAEAATASEDTAPIAPASTAPPITPPPIPPPGA